MLKFMVLATLLTPPELADLNVGQVPVYKMQLHLCIAVQIYLYPELEWATSYLLIPGCGSSQFSQGHSGKLILLLKLCLFRGE